MARSKERQQAAWRKITVQRMQDAVTRHSQLTLLSEPLPGWQLRHRKSNGVWASLILHRVVVADDCRKAVFWLGWNVVERRLAACADVQRLVEHEPELHQAVLRDISRALFSVV